MNKTESSGKSTHLNCFLCAKAEMVYSTIIDSGESYSPTLQNINHFVAFLDFNPQSGSLVLPALCTGWKVLVLFLTLFFFANSVHLTFQCLWEKQHILERGA